MLALVSSKWQILESLASLDLNHSNISCSSLPVPMESIHHPQRGFRMMQCNVVLISSADRPILFKCTQMFLFVVESHDSPSGLLALLLHTLTSGKRSALQSSAHTYYMMSCTGSLIHCIGLRCCEITHSPSILYSGIMQSTFGSFSLH